MPGAANGMILTVGDHVAVRYGADNWRSVATVTASSIALIAVDRRRIDDREPGGLGEEIDAAGEGGGSSLTCSPASRFAERLRRLVLVDVSRFEARRR